MPRYRRKAATVEAMRWTGKNHDEVMSFLGADFHSFDPLRYEVIVATEHGNLRAPVDHYLLRESGRCRPIAPDVFKRTFEVHRIDPELNPIWAVGAEEIRRLYWDEGLPTTVIAAKLGVAHTSVQRYMRRQGIPLRPAGGFHAGRKNA